MIDIDLNDAGTTYTDKFLVSHHGSENCFVLGGEAYVIQSNHENEHVIHFFRKTQAWEWEKTDEPSDAVLDVAEHECHWKMYDYWFMNVRSEERRHPTDEDLNKSLACPVAPKQYGSVDFLSNKIYQGARVLVKPKRPRYQYEYPEVRDPCGKVHTVIGSYAKFCKDKDISPRSISLLVSGKLATSKGWASVR